MMNVHDLIVTLLRNDARLIARSGLLLVLLAMVFVIAVGMRFALPALDVSLAAHGVLPNESTPLRFSETYALWVVFIGLWQAALIPGTVCGFLLLDEKEDHTLVVMSVSPVPSAAYVLYRVALPYLLAVGGGLAVIPLMGIDVLPWGQRVWLALCGGLVAPVTTLALATFAHDKVQGLALTKFTGIAGLVIIGAWFVEGPWQWACALFPPYLVCKAYWMALAGEPWWWAVALAGGLAQALCVWVLGRRFLARSM